MILKRFLLLSAFVFFIPLFAGAVQTSAAKSAALAKVAGTVETELYENNKSDLRISHLSAHHLEGNIPEREMEYCLLTRELFEKTLKEHTDSRYLQNNLSLSTSSYDDSVLPEVVRALAESNDYMFSEENFKTLRKQLEKVLSQLPVLEDTLVIGRRITRIRARGRSLLPKHTNTFVGVVRTKLMPESLEEARNVYYFLFLNTRSGDFVHVLAVEGRI